MYLAGILAVLYLTIQVYAPALHGPFLFDDRNLPYFLPGFSHSLKFWIAGVRPVLMFTYWLNYESGNDPFSFHAVNLAVHLANTALVFFILQVLLQRSEPESRQSSLLAACCAGIFLLHPIQTESVAYIAGRSECLSALFVLAALAIFLKRTQNGASWETAVVAFVLYAAALATKEHTLVLPGLLLLTDYYWNTGFALPGIRRNWRIYLPLALAGAGGAVFAIGVLASTRSAGFNLKAFTWYQYFFTECRAFFLYLRLFIVPLGQDADWDFPVSRNVLDHGAIFALLILVTLVVAAIHFRKSYPLESYGFLFYLLLMAPTSSFLPIQDPVAERRMYLPVMGLLMVVAALLRRLRLRPWKLAVPCALVAALLAGLTDQRNRLWASDIDLWEDVAVKSPGKARVHFQLAFAYYTAGRCRDAVTQYGEMARLQKPDHQVLLDWGLAYECAGQPDQAIATLREAAALRPTAHVLSQIGLVYARQARWPEALEALAEAERLDSNYAMTYCYRGGVRAATGDFVAAVSEYQRASVLDPGNQAALQGLEFARRHLPPPRR